MGTYNKRHWLQSLVDVIGLINSWIQKPPLYLTKAQCSSDKAVAWALKDKNWNGPFESGKTQLFRDSINVTRKALCVALSSKLHGECMQFSMGVSHYTPALPAISSCWPSHQCSPSGGDYGRRGLLGGAEPLKSDAGWWMKGRKRRRRNRRSLSNRRKVPEVGDGDIWQI